jgi:hypothetical protein
MTMPMIEILGLKEDLILQCLNKFAKMLNIELPNLSIFVDETDQIKVNGACYQNAPDDYMIVLKDQENEGRIIQTLAHEMVHVKQYLKNDLASHFTYEIPYMERWWEIEAFEKEKELMLALLQDIKEGKITV